MPSSPPTPRQRRKDARPQELLAAALSLFVEKGFSATRSEEVAQRAGVSKGTLYLYFPSKEDLLKAAIRQTLAAEIAEGGRRAEATNEPIPQVLSTVLSQWWIDVFHGPSSGVFKLIITEMCNFPELAEFYAREVIEPGTAVIEALLQTGIARGELRMVDTRRAVHSLIMPMIMLCLHKHSLGACGFVVPELRDPERFIRSHIDLIVNGLLPRADTHEPPPMALPT